MALALAILLTVALGYWAWSSWRSTERLPPGPSRLPLVGNLHQLRGGWVRKSLEWHKKYGPLVTLKLGGRTALLLGNETVAKDLLDKRGRIYSSRPRLVMACDIMSRGDHTFFLPYGPKWRNHNRIQISFLNARAVKQYRPLQELESLATLRHMLDSTDFEQIFLRFQASLVTTLAYGSRIADLHDEGLQEIERIARAFIEGVSTNNWLVDSFPALNALPSWLAPWKRFGNHIHSEMVRVNGPMIEEGGRRQSWNWVKHVRSLKDVDQVDDHEILFIIGSIYQAGADIITTYLLLFLMAAVLHPAEVETAQAELDRVVGHDRLPGFQDFGNLPYTEAFVHEVLRWRPLAALGIPHALTEDDSYEGYFIPKGTFILPNQYAMEMDASRWEDPEQFHPDRWIKDPTRTPSVFGFGRRKCVGQLMATESLFIMISRMLWVFNFTHAEDNGKRVEIDPWGFTQATNTLVPKPFRCQVLPRDEKRQHVLESTWKLVDKDVDCLLNHVGDGVLG